MKTNVRRLVYLAIFCAISVVLIYVIHLPLFPAAPFLEYDPADVPLLLAGFMFGPLWGILTTVVACAVQATSVSAASGIIGFFMHVFATGVYVLVAGTIYRFSKKTLGATVTALVAATLAATAMMIPLNLIFTPMYGTPIEAVRDMMWTIIVPFNLIKFSMNSVLTALIYRLLRRFIKG